MCKLRPGASAVVVNVKGPDTTHVQRNAWRHAGFDAFLIAGHNRVRFSRIER